MIIEKQQINHWESRYRAKFLNSLAGIKQAFLIGTKSEDQKTNLALFNSLIHIGANPPLWGFICRPDVVQRDSLRNILATESYTINFVGTDYAKQAHQTSAKYPTDVSEFAACGFTEDYKERCDAPFVAEAHVKIAMKLQQKIDISINNTILIIGSIESVDINQNLIATDGFVALDKGKTLACAGLDAYYETSLIYRLSYAQPDTLPEQI